jgi:hypothetical protein
MKSLIPFSLQTPNKNVNTFLLPEGGLAKNQTLNIYFNDSIGKRELVYDLMLASILPKEWGNGDSNVEPILIPEG